MQFTLFTIQASNMNWFQLSVFTLWFGISCYGLAVRPYFVPSTVDNDFITVCIILYTFILYLYVCMCMHLNTKTHIPKSYTLFCSNARAYIYQRDLFITHTFTAHRTNERTNVQMNKCLIQFEIHFRFMFFVGVVRFKGRNTHF